MSLSQEFIDWLNTRPKAIQSLALKFPPGTFIEGHGWVVGYAEAEKGSSLYISMINPSIDYDGAIATKKLLCHDCLP